MNYMESKKKLDGLRGRDEIIFRMAISHLMDVGTRHLAEENAKKTCEKIMKENDNGIMTSEFQCKIIKTAAEISKVDHIHLLTYIGREVYYRVE